MKEGPLNYASPEEKDDTSPSDGFKALLLSVIPPTFLGSLFMYRQVLLGDFWIGTVLLLSWLAWILSFAFAYFAWDDGRRQRRLGLIAAGVSIGWPLLIPVSVLILAFLGY